MGLGIKKVTQRKYRGYCRFNGLVPAAVADFQRAQPAILELFETHSGLNASTRKKTLKFLSRFFEVIGDPKSLEKNILDNCEGKKP